MSGDGCNGACQLEGGSGADCGNGAIGPAEICDDGNTTNGDACNPTCNFANTTSLVAGSPGMSGWVDGTGTAARFDSGLSLTLGSDAIYATASGGFRILRLDPATGDVRRIAGTGTMGSFDSTNGLSATFNSPWGLATDGVTLWVADGQTIRAIGPPPGRAVSTVAGTMVTRGCTDGIGAGATMSDARAPVWYRGRVYFVDATCATLRTFDPVTREVRTIAGAPMTSGSVDGSGGAVRFVSPRFMVSDGSGTLFIADTNGGRIRTYHTGADVVRTLAGSAPGYLDGAVATAQIHRPRGLTSDGTSIYFTEFNVHTVRQIDLRRGRVSTMIGTECACTPMCCAGGYAEGVGASAQLSGPWDVLFHPPTRSLYVFDGGNFVLRRVR